MTDFLGRGTWRSGALVSFFLTLLVSGSVLAVRLSRGHLSMAWLASAVVTLGAILCATSLDVFTRPPTLREERRASLLSAHAFGVVVGLGLVHVALVLRGTSIDPALVERPSQLVNDLVLVGAILSVCWSLDAASLVTRVGVPVLALVVVAAYRATANRWHADGFPGFAVQRFVVHQCVATLGALFLFDVFRPRGPAR